MTEMIEPMPAAINQEELARALVRSYGGLESECGAGLRFCLRGWWLSWLLQGKRDRGADEVEGLPLFAGGLGEHWDGGGVPPKPTWLRVRVARWASRPRKLR
jgi:hypothetical protein